MRIIRLDKVISLTSAKYPKKFNPQLGILVTPVSLEVLSDRNSLLDEVVEILGNGRGKTLGNVSCVPSSYP